MKILSVDQSTTSSGYCIMEIFPDNTYELLSYGLYKPKGDVEERILDTCNFFSDVIKKENIKLCVLENVQSQSNPSTFRLLAMLLGALIEMIDVNGSEYVIVAPSTWRKILPTKRGMKRKELKALSKQYVLDEFKITVNDDISDSICIGIWFCHYYGYEYFN